MPADDYGSDISTTGSVLVGGSVTGTLETAGDRDWFAVSLTAGETYVFDLEGSATGAGTLDDPYLWLWSGAGDFIGSNDDGGSDLNSQLVYTPSSSGTYYLSAHAFNADDTGSYTLTATFDSLKPEATPDEFADFLTNGYWDWSNRTSRHWEDPIEYYFSNTPAQNSGSCP